MTTLTLSENQRQQAEQILQRIENQKIHAPQSVVSEWLVGPSWDEFNERVEYDVHGNTLKRKEKWVDPSNIAGVIGPGESDDEMFDPETDMKPTRLKRILRSMLDGEFELDYQSPPDYVEFDGTFYVTVDGRHRSLACKALDIGEILGRVAIVR